MTPPKILLLLVCTAMAFMPTFVTAEFPVIVAGEGFEIDLEPFQVEILSDMLAANNGNVTGTIQELEDALEHDMRESFPNLMGVIFHTYKENRTITLSTTVDTLAAMPGSNQNPRILYTGMVVFVGPPYRTGHEVYTAQTTALGSFPSTNIEATMGVPSWFDPVAYSDGTRDSNLMDNLDLSEMNSDNNANMGGQKANNDEEPSTKGLVIGAIFGCIFGVLAIGTLMMCYFRYVRAYKTTSGNPKTFTKKALAKMKKKQDKRNSNTMVKSHSKSEEFFEDEYGMEEGRSGHSDTLMIPSSPVVHRKKGKNTTRGSPQGVPEFDITPTRRRPSHHRRWKSSTMNNVDFGLGGDPAYSDYDTEDNTDNVDSNSDKERNQSKQFKLQRKDSSHRRANSLGVNLSVAVSGNPNIRRRPSMAELLGMEELNNDDEDEEEFTF